MGMISILYTNLDLFLVSVLAITHRTRTRPYHHETSFVGWKLELVIEDDGIYAIYLLLSPFAARARGVVKSSVHVVLVWHGQTAS